MHTNVQPSTLNLSDPKGVWTHNVDFLGLIGQVLVLPVRLHCPFLNSPSRLGVSFCSSLRCELDAEFYRDAGLPRCAMQWLLSWVLSSARDKCNSQAENDRWRGIYLLCSQEPLSFPIPWDSLFNQHETNSPFLLRHPVHA